jgi:hypothetical protein
VLTRHVGKFSARPKVTSRPRTSSLRSVATHNTMVLRIRLARFGKKHAPFYNVVVAHARYVIPRCPQSMRESAKPPPPANSPLLHERPMLYHRRHGLHTKTYGIRLTVTQNSSQLPPSRSPRNPRPQAATPTTRRHTRPAMERHQARHLARAVLGRCGRTAKRHGVAVTEHGGHTGAAV